MRVGNGPLPSSSPRPLVRAPLPSCVFASVALRRCAAALPYLALGDAKDGSVGAAYFSVLVRVARASGEARHVAAVEPLLCAALCRRALP